MKLDAFLAKIGNKLCVQSLKFCLKTFCRSYIAYFELILSFFYWKFSMIDSFCMKISAQNQNWPVGVGLRIEIGIIENWDGSRRYEMDLIFKKKKRLKKMVFIRSNVWISSLSVSFSSFVWVYLFGSFAIDSDYITVSVVSFEFWVQKLANLIHGHVHQHQHKNTFENHVDNTMKNINIQEPTHTHKQPNPKQSHFTHKSKFELKIAKMMEQIKPKQKTNSTNQKENIQ